MDGGPVFHAKGAPENLKKLLAALGAQAQQSQIQKQKGNVDTMSERTIIGRIVCLEHEANFLRVIFDGGRAIHLQTSTLDPKKPPMVSEGPTDYTKMELQPVGQLPGIGTLYKQVFAEELDSESPPAPSPAGPEPAAPQG